MGAVQFIKRATALLAATAFLAFVPAASAADAGKVNFDLNSTSKFDSLLTSSTPEQQAWMHDTYSRVRGYAPFFNQALSWHAPADFYQDLYALYRDGRDDQALIAAHPDWVLRNANGQKLFIPSGCGNNTCPQFAADIGSPGFRQHWIDQAKATLAQGYVGIFIDDVNTEMTVSDGNGNRTRPIDPRTNQPMTDAAWGSYVAQFVQEIRAQIPNAEIVQNTPWYEPQSDPNVQAAVASANTIEIERGFNDPGITGGNGTFGYDTLLQHIDWLHSQGVGVILEPYLSTAKQARYEVANYLLTSNGSDAISSDWRATPTDFSSIWATNLGAPKGNRYLWRGLERRDFAGGSVLVNPPGAPKVVVKFKQKGMYSPAKAEAGKVSKSVRRVAIKPARGAILRTS